MRFLSSLKDCAAQMSFVAWFLEFLDIHNNSAHILILFKKESVQLQNLYVFYSKVRSFLS